jgi:hypothetical protein
VSTAPARRDRRRVLDTSALEHVATGRSVYARALVEQNNVLVVPTTALTTACARIPTEAHPVLEVLDGSTAQEVGLLLATAGGRGKLAVGHVVWCARQRGWPVLTANPNPLRQLDPDVDIEELP